MENLIQQTASNLTTKQGVLTKRIGILRSRLEPVSEYIALASVGGPNAKSFAQFLAEKGVSRDEFVADLPDYLKNPPASGLDDIMNYAGKLNAEYVAIGKSIPSMDRGLAMASMNLKELKKGEVDGDYTPMEPRYLNGDGTVAIKPEEDTDNWVEMLIIPDKSEDELRWAMGRAWTWIVKWEADVEEISKQPPAGIQQMIARNGILNYLQMKIDDGMAIIDWLSKRIDKTMSFEQARDAFKQHMRDRKAEQMELLNNANAKPSRKYIDKFTGILNEITKNAKQNWKSIVSGLKKSPKEILDDLKREGLKSLGDAKDWVKENVNIHNANKYNPVFVVAREGFKTLLGYNFFALARTFQRMMNDPNQAYWDKITQKWDNFGGEKDALIKVINQGANKTALFYKPGGYKIEFNADGENKAAIITGSIGVLTAATPAIVNGIAAGTMSPAVAKALIAAGGVITAMAPVMVAFGKNKGENVSGSTEDVPVGAGEMPPSSTPEGTSSGFVGAIAALPTGAKWAIGLGIGGAAIAIILISVFGGTKKSKSGSSGSGGSGGSSAGSGGASGHSPSTPSMP